MGKIINTILSNSVYSLTQFTQQEIEALENKIIIKKDKKNKEKYYVNCIIRNKEIELKPEEIVRQLYTKKLIDIYGYPKERITFEYGVKQGSKKDTFADIVIFDKDKPTQPYIIIETKQPKENKEQEILEQLESYCKTKGASIGVICNGSTIEEYFVNRENKKSKVLSLEKITYLPKATETLEEILNAPYTIKDLKQNDILQTKTLKNIILTLEDKIIAHAAVESTFKEIFKLIFTKLYDELQSADDADDLEMQLKNGKEITEIDDSQYRRLEFRNIGNEKVVAEKIKKLFEEAKDKWKGIFDENENIKLQPKHLKICVSYLQDVKLFNSNLEVVDDAFEHLVNKETKGEKGQYFTPRYIIDMCVKMLNPQEKETMIDTACGSCGFPMHTIFYVWNKINPKRNNLFSTQKRTVREIDYVKNKVFAIDYDPNCVRIGRTLNIIAGDGHTNVLHLDSLDMKSFYEGQKNDSKWRKAYSEGFARFEDFAENENYKNFKFDILMANPPFAGDYDIKDVLEQYDLGKKDGNTKKKVGREILFIEKNINMLKPGGRMAIVLPQGIFNNSSDKYIRDFISERCRILAVVGLHQNVFKPHTGTKTSVLFVQKWDNELCHKKEDYPIFFATMQKPTKDNSGDKIYVKNEDGSLARDNHGHIYVDHDLFNHDGLTKDGIAEAFIEFAKKEGLSFF